MSCCSVSIGGLDSLPTILNRLKLFTSLAKELVDPIVRLYLGPQRGGDAELLREMSTLGALRLEHVENFNLAKQYCPQVKLVVAEDNEAVIKIIKKGRSAKLRHIHRTHRVDTDWLYELFS